MRTLENTTSSKITGLRIIVGITFILAGVVFFLDQYLKTGWLSLFILPTIGSFFYFWGIRQRHTGMIIVGGVLGGLGAGSLAGWGPGVQLAGTTASGLLNPTHSFLGKVGLLALFTGVGWGLVALTTVAVTPRPTWWALIPGGVIGGLGACVLFTPMYWTDFVLYVALGTGFPLLLWGLFSRLFGLVIPGCLLVSIGGGIYAAWPPIDIGNTLVRTGIMLIWFALGWVLITVGGKAITHKYIWWPLIPGGILAMVGMGLYIGGDPTRALGFIGNTGSIALVIFGLYLLLMRKGIHH